MAVGRRAHGATVEPDRGRPSSHAVTEDSSGPVALCYDGSKHAAEAIDAAATLLRGATAVVVTVWTPVREALVAVSLGPAPAITDPGEGDERQRRAAQQLAEEGSRRATEAGLEARPLAVRGGTRVWEAIEATADELGAPLIVCGTRRTGPVSALLDTVPGALVNHAARAVMVIPSAAAAAERRRALRDEERSATAHAAPHLSR
jgi:nucleotide-binding universal stress UspA family protein